MKTILTLIAYLLVIVGATAQRLDHVQGDILVQLKPNVTLHELVRDLATYKGKPTEMHAGACLSEHNRIWRIAYRHEAFDENDILNAVRQHETVREAQFNHTVSLRAVPNDPSFVMQWQYINSGANGGVADADIDADLAWNITTGGLTPLGDTIVVAVIDDGIDALHQDMQPNRWRNYHEIPNNGIDDDQNGYVDDFRGWSSVSLNDAVDGSFAGGHGTSVASIVGARGNNNLGVTGVNWKVKLMIIDGGTNDEAEVIRAYTYVLRQRQLYDQTAGARGAFVVATNASWGTDFGFAANYPLWCAFYDTLGQHGILNVGATSNRDINVDVQGDMPTTCSSLHLIGVTNTRRDDVKETSAGYGATSIDLGAPGTDTYTASIGNSYGAFGGTSAAAPHVTGAIALLHAAPCPSFAALEKANPEAANLLLRDYILQGVDPNASLNGITTTGGRLNLNNALLRLMNDCSSSSCYRPFRVRANTIGMNQIELTWDTINPPSGGFRLRYRPQGGSTWVVVNTPNPVYNVPNLIACTPYEFQVQAVCGADTSGYTASLLLRTDGCCESPTTIQITNTTTTTATVTWNNVLVATHYELHYRPVGATTWQTINGIMTNSYVLTSLTPCLPYELQLQTHCIITWTPPPSVIVPFQTEGCGPCRDLPYCTVLGNSSGEYIERVQIAGLLDNPSGNNAGFGNFLNTFTVSLNTNTTYSATLTPGFGGGTVYGEYFRVYIDYNQDGDFLDADEQIIDSGQPTSNAITRTFTVPASATIGTTRMRVAMQWRDPLDPCTSTTYGEIEDYCVTIAAVTPILSVQNPFERISLQPNPFTDQIDLTTATPLEHVQLQVWAADGRQVLVKKDIAIANHYALSFPNDLPSGWYVLRLVHPEGSFCSKPIWKK